MKLISNQLKWLASLIILVAAILLIGGCTPANQPPVISSLAANEELIIPTGIYQIECIASDPDEDEISYTWSVDVDAGNISGEGPVVTWVAPNTYGTYTIAVTVTDGKGNEVTARLTIDVIEVAVNEPPIISSLTANEGWIAPAGISQVECIASDPDEDELSYSWSASGGDISGGGSTVTWIAPDSHGTYIIAVTVTDGKGNKVTAHLTIEVIDVTVNRPPVIDDLFSEWGRVRKAATPTIECVASDPNGDELSYTWSVDAGEIFGEGPVVTWVAPNTYGTYTITVTVTDGEGGEASDSIGIIVCSC